MVSRRFRGAAVLRLHEARGDRDDLVGESAGVDRRERPLMAAQRERVLLFARDARFARVILGDQAGTQIDVGIVIDERRVRRHRVAAHRHETHRLGAAGDDRTSADPHMMRSAANAIACRPDEQNRLIVTADALTGTPARRLAIRATFRPCSASGIAQPRMTSSISAGVDAGRAAQRLGDRRRGEFVGPGPAQGAVRAPCRLAF